MNCDNCPSNKFNNLTEQIEGKYDNRTSYDWLKNLPKSADNSSIVEVSFKNNRKEFYINENLLELKHGDYIAVQCDSGHGIGMVSLAGKMAELQLKRKVPLQNPTKIIYRLAKKTDIDKLVKVRLKEKPVMIKARQIAQSMGLEMKISDVEFQGDGTKVTIYYIADGRVDFRELIKVYAKEFSVRIEMKQIGARQESALVGGIGSCGRELCCSSWRNKFDTVTTKAARIQEISHNAEKLTGQCGKLKCCLMYELEQYIEAHSDFPDELLELETDKGIAYPQKKDLLKRAVYYSVGLKESSELVIVSLDRVKEIIQLNKKGIKPSIVAGNKKVDFTNFTNSFETKLTKSTNNSSRKEVRKKHKTKYPGKR